MKLNKKSIGMIVIVLLAISITGWFLVTRNNKSEQAKKQNTKISEKVVEQNGQGEQKTKMERETVQTEPQLSAEEIEKLKKEKDLVWYEIPELGIKFLVPREMKSFLIYKKFGNKVYFCDLDLWKYQLKKEKKLFRWLATEAEWNNDCSQGYLLEASKSALQKIEMKGGFICHNKIYKDNNQIICFLGPQSPGNYELEFRKTNIGKNHPHINWQIIKRYSFIK